MHVEDFYAPTQIGRTRSLTPEGFLICRDVAIARTGEQVYLPSEIEFEDGSHPQPSRDGVIYADRLPEDVFHADTLASFEGKPITDNHPPATVTSQNWRQYGIGHLQRVRRGEGADADLLMADLVIKDAAAIRAVQMGKVQVSCGYDARYVPGEAQGRVKQTNIIGNHLALVKRGRAGARCAIGDEDMAVTIKPKNWVDKVRDAFTAKDSTGLEALLGEVQHTEPVKDADPQAARLAALTATVTDLATVVSKLVARDEKSDDDETAEEKAARLKKEKDDDKTKDALPAAALAEIVSRAEILAPGFKAPTMDAATADAAANTQRAVLLQAFATEEGKKAIEPFLGARDLAALSTTDLATVFAGAAELRRISNNARTADVSDAIRKGVGVKDFGRAPMTPAEINAANAAAWANRSGQAL